MWAILRRSCSRPRSKLIALFIVVCCCLSVSGRISHFVLYWADRVRYCAETVSKASCWTKQYHIFTHFFLLLFLLFSFLSIIRTARITHRRWRPGSHKIAPPLTCSGSKRPSTRYEPWMDVWIVYFLYFLRIQYLLYNVFVQMAGLLLVLHCAALDAGCALAVFVSFHFSFIFCSLLGFPMSFFVLL